VNERGFREPQTVVIIRELRAGGFSAITELFKKSPGMLNSVKHDINGVNPVSVEVSSESDAVHLAEHYSQRNPKADRQRNQALPNVRSIALVEGSNRKSKRCDRHHCKLGQLQGLYQYYLLHFS
jgi:hypothetical protein